MYEKNGWPWAGMLNTKLKASNSLVDKMISYWNATNWGDSFENYRRPTYQCSIYTSTRSRQMPSTTPDEALIELTHLAYNEVTSLFSEKMYVYMSELSCLLPQRRVPWHHDGMSMCFYGTRIILPLLNLENIMFSFSSWNDKTPTDSAKFAAMNFMDTDIVSFSIEPSYYYIYNHRVPHQTISFSEKPRAMFAIDLIPEKHRAEASVHIDGKPAFKEISQEEKTKIIPVILL
jgi:hypothetical protein